MPVKKPAKKSAPPAKPSTAKRKSGSRELNDDDLKVVSGGLSAKAGVSVTDTGGCVSQF
jgi:hypothetical protein